MARTKYYHPFNTAFGSPWQKGFFYECLNCGETVSAAPSENFYCGCGNLGVDIDFGRLLTRNPEQVRLFSWVEQNTD